MPVRIGAKAHSFSDQTGLVSDCHRNSDPRRASILKDKGVSVSVSFAVISWPIHSGVYLPLLAAELVCDRRNS